MTDTAAVPVNLVRASTAPAYDPPGHFDVDARRLQGLEAGGPSGFWVGRSVYPPGARAELSPTSADTVYVVLEGDLEVGLDNQNDLEVPVLLGAGDSLFLACGTARSVHNRTDSDAVLLVILQPRGTA